MEKNKKTIILASIVVIIIILIIILNIIKSSANNQVNILKDEKEFFTINTLLNSELEDEKYMDSNYYATNIYYKEFDLIKVYFVKGFFIGTSNENTYNANDNYIVKTKGIAYEIEPLNATNIEEYVSNYELNTTEFNSTNILPTYSYNEKNKLISYLSTYNALLLYDKTKAYNYLSESQKKKYNSASDFENKAKLLNTNIQSYNKNNNIYTIHTKEETITIYEKSVMNFSIEY